MSKSKLERSLYPSVVCHFTRRSSVLISILQSMFFKVSYAKEEIIGTDASRTFGIPMVSFCDIRLSQLNEHITKYGRYGIALNKGWAISNGLNPVSYISKDCSMFGRLDARLRELRSSMKHIKSEGAFEEYKMALEQYNDFINTMRYMKNYEGNLIRNKKPLIKNYRFANEHEWRYIPDVDSDIIPIKKIVT
ncbi:abortive infection system antitoxin AbiGi family protein, partial [Klebsiella quasipneumoniae]